MTCTNCGRPIPPEARFCPNCGAPAPAATPLGTEERKIVTVLFADLVDSTGLGERLDPERAREVMGAFFEAVSEELVGLRGRAEKYIGDAVMAVFGLPTVSEDDALRAVRAGLAIRDRTRRLGRTLGLGFPLEVRVGIESGDVATGTGPAEQLLVTGQAVNAAARLQVAADPGEVLAGETAHDLTRQSVVFGEVRTVEAKGFGVALSAYPVERLSVRSTRRTIPMVGRRAELGLLGDALARVASTGRSCLFTVTGEPGVGKSRLVDEMLAGLEGDVTALLGRAEPFGGRGTFAPVADMLRTLAGVEEDESPETTRERLEEVVDGCCEATEAARVSARLALVMGLRDQGRDEPSFVQEAQSGFLGLVDGLVQRGPLVLVFDDVHQAAPPLLDLIERVAGRAAHHHGPVLVVAAGRPDFLDARPDWGSATANHLKIRLEPLSVRDSVELVRAAAGDTLSRAVARSVAARTGGNPFFIVETTGLLARRQETGGERALGVPAQLAGPLPPTVRALLAARLDHLDPRLRALARTTSVFLYSFDADELALVAPGATQEDLHALEDEEILVAERRPMRWWFRTETLRDVAYAGLPKRERVRLHTAVADGIAATGDVDSAAEHLEHAAIAALDLDPGDRTLADRAADALKEAGDRARGRMENLSAIAFYERALAMAGPQEGWGVREARVLAGMGEARYWRGEYGPALEVLVRAVDLGERLGDTWTIAHALRFRGDIAMNVGGDLAEAKGYLDRSLAAAEELGDTRAVARTLLFAGWIPWEQQNLPAAEAMWSRALELARENKDRWAETRALTSLSSIRSEMGEPGQAESLTREALAVAQSLGDQFSEAVALAQLGRQERLRGRVEDSLPHLHRAVGIFEELGARWELGDALGERGDVHRQLGHLDAAESDLQASVRISEELGERQLAGWAWRQLAKVAERRGDRAEAEERLRRADEEDRRRPQ